MPSDPPLCPDCGSPLRKGSGPQAHSYRCPACAGTLVGFAPFRDSLADGVGRHLWVAAADGPGTKPCPICPRPMRSAGPAGLAICRGCEEVWVPASAEPWLAANAAPDRPVSLQPGECANCGAPYQPDEDGRCRYCRAQISAPAPVVIVEQAAPAPRGGLWGLLDQPL